MPIFFRMADVVTHETYQGRVVAVESRIERVMSDIYADVGVAVVINDDGSFTRIGLGAQFELNPDYQTALVDASAMECQAYSKFLADQQAARELARSEDHAMQMVKTIKIGSRIIVTRGRKVPKGTVGVVLFLTNGSYGTRVGFTSEGQTDTLWTNLSNVEVSHPNIDPVTGNLVQGATWRAISDDLQSSSRPPMLFRRGDQVRLIADRAKSGKVFWIDDHKTRLGFHIAGDINPVWAHFSQVEAVVGAPIWATYQYAIDGDAVEKLPAPFNQIKMVVCRTDHADAQDCHGRVIMTLPFDGLAATLAVLGVVV